MSKKSVLTNFQFWLALLIVFLAIFLALASYSDLLNEITEIRISQYTLHHWFTIAGTLWIAIFTPIYYFMKRKYIGRFRGILFTHVFSNLISLTLISIHFAHQLGRPAQFYPDLGTGIVLYQTVILLVFSGFLRRFNLFGGRNYVFFLHKSLTVTFYFVIIVHLLHGFGII